MNNKIRKTEHLLSKQIGIIEKICNSCKIIKPVSDFSLKKTILSGFLPRSACKACRVLEAKNWRIKNPQKSLEYFKLSCLKNPDKHKKWLKKSYQKRKETLSDSYVKDLLIKKTTLTRAQIPVELVKAKQIQLQIKRFLEDQNEKR
jgi:hypothetical protein